MTSGKENSISSIILLNLYARIGFSGIFCFVYMYRIDFILFTLLVVFLLRRLEKRILVLFELLTEGLNIVYEDCSRDNTL